MSDSKKYIKVCCRLCGKEMLFPRGFIKKKILLGGSVEAHCRIRAKLHMKEINEMGNNYI